jgi:hypothetical protein
VRTLVHKVYLWVQYDSTVLMMEAASTSGTSVNSTGVLGATSFILSDVRTWNLSFRTSSLTTFIVSQNINTNMIVNLDLIWNATSAKLQIIFYPGTLNLEYFIILIWNYAFEMTVGKIAYNFSCIRLYIDTIRTARCIRVHRSILIISVCTMNFELQRFNNTWIRM